MGQSLSEPKTEKETEKFGNGDYAVAVSGMQGWRQDMEDSWSVELPFSPAEPGSGFFAVFDGHGSRLFSSYCSKQLHHFLLDNSNFSQGESQAGLRESFHSLDLVMQQDESLQLHKEPGGTTAVVALIKDNWIICANVGDSRAIASSDGKVVELSHDHKPTLPTEERRIYRAGGWVEFNRVNGNLALSRALGDFEFKKNKTLPAEEQIVTADPDITSFPLSLHHEFMVLACDGVWDVMTNDEVLDFVRRRIAQKLSPTQICECLLDHCLAPDCRMGGVGCDNMTVILVCFLHGRPYAELVERCSRPPSSSPRHSCCNHHSQNNQGNHFCYSCPNSPGTEFSVEGGGNQGELYNHTLGTGGLANQLNRHLRHGSEGHSTDQHHQQQLSCTV